MPQSELTLGQGLNIPSRIITASKSAGNRFIKPIFFKIDEDKLAIEQGAVADKTSWLGTPTYDVLRIPAFSYTDNNGQQVNIGAEIDFDTVLLEVSQTRNIVTTAVQGRNGTVKEYISDGDYQISVNGVISTKYNNVAPFESDIAYVNSIFSMLKANVSVPVACNFLDMFQINSMVIMDYKLNQIEGARNTIGFSMNCLSDEPFEIKYTEKQTSVPSFIG
jgi:hypothetical protein